MTDNSRAIRLAEAIKEIVATTLDTKIRDPRLGFVTVTGAKVTGDLQHATVYYTVFGDEAQAQASAVALESSKGLLRTEVGRQTGIKHTPSLAFQFDRSPQAAADLAEAMRAARTRDEEIRAMAEGKTPAGEANPYKSDSETNEADDTSDDLGLPDEDLAPVDPAGFVHDADADDPTDPGAAAADVAVAASSFDADQEALAEGETL